MQNGKPLTARFVAEVARPGRYTDGRRGFGLSLLVKQSASGHHVTKSWSQRIKIGNNRVMLGLGGFPVVSLKEARDNAFENRRSVEHGVDPRRPDVPTFQQAAERYIEDNESGWTSDVAQNWRSTLKKRAYPKIGRRRIDAILAPDVRDVLLPVWNTKPTMAKKLLRRISAVMRAAQAAGYRSDNPAEGFIRHGLPRWEHQPVSHPAHPHAEINRMLRQADQATLNPVHALALQLAALTATRNAETSQAQWSEIDLGAAVWTIPATRMKANREHRVPLSRQALDVLHSARSHSGDSEFVFPGKSQGKPLHPESVRRLLKKVAPEASVHGLRSSFTDWAAEVAGADKLLRDLVLAHVNQDQVEAAYLRTDLVGKRAALMQEWADYIMP